MIISITRDWGMDPSIVRIVTSDTLAVVGTPNYIYDQRFVIYDLNGGQFQWVTTDMVLVYSTSDSAWGYFTITPDFLSLTLFESMAGTANAPINTNITEMRALQCIQSPAGANNLCFSYIVNAVNYLQSTNALSTGMPTLSALGTDANVNLHLSSKGAGTTVITSPSSTTALVLNPNGGAFNANFITPITATRSYTFQDASGTVAFLSDVSNSSSYNIVTGTSQTVAENTKYMANNAGLVTFTIPPTFTAGKWFKVIGGPAGGGWRVQQSIATHQIKLLAISSTLGIGGIVNSTDPLDGAEFVCMVANNVFEMQEVVGNPDLL